MFETELKRLAESLRGQGWLGVMELVDFLDQHSYSDTRSLEIKAKLQIKLGQVILGQEGGCDETAIKQACDECIDSIIRSPRAGGTIL